MNNKRCCFCGTELPLVNGFFKCCNCNVSYDKNGAIINKMQQLSPSLVTCKACQGKISNQASTCPHCGQPTGVHVCPKCGSADTEVISGASKAVSVGLWGVFAANKVMAKYVCNKCSHKF